MKKNKPFFWYAGSMVLIMITGIFLFVSSASNRKDICTDASFEKIVTTENDTTNLHLSANRKNVQSFSRLWSYSEVFMY